MTISQVNPPATDIQYQSQTPVSRETTAFFLASRSRKLNSVNNFTPPMRANVPSLQSLAEKKTFGNIKALADVTRIRDILDVHALNTLFTPRAQDYLTITVNQSNNKDALLKKMYSECLSAGETCQSIAERLGFKENSEDHNLLQSYLINSIDTLSLLGEGSVRDVAEKYGFTAGNKVHTKFMRNSIYALSSGDVENNQTAAAKKIDAMRVLFGIDNDDPNHKKMFDAMESECIEFLENLTSQKNNSARIFKEMNLELEEYRNSKAYEIELANKIKDTLWDD